MAFNMLAFFTSPRGLRVPLLYFPAGFASPPQGGDEISLRGELRVKEVEYGSTKNFTDQDRTIGVA